MADSKMAEPRLMKYELRFRPLADKGMGYTFPCGPDGRVDLDQLSEQARTNYLYARAVVGRELAAPAVAQAASLDPSRPEPIKRMQ